MRILIFAISILLILGVLAFFLSTDTTHREIILTKNAPQPIGPYSQAIKTGNTLYVAGQVGIDPEGKVDTSSIENECTQALKNIKAILEAADMNMDQIVKTTIYLKDIKNFNEVNNVYGSFFSNTPPARETIQAGALPKNMHVEISVIAVQ